jgi:hypothetical protein
MIQLNPTVGVAPGTATLAFGGLGNCPPDELRQYVTPPVVTAGYPSGVTPDGIAAGSVYYPSPSGLASGGVDPSLVMSSMGMNGTQRWNPYQDLPQLKGLGDDTSGDSSLRWSLVLFAGVATFAAAFGFLYLRRKK